MQGRVRDVRGRPRSGLRVKALDLDLRNHQQLGGIAITGAEGNYAISYGVDEFILADGKAPLVPDVFVKVLPHDGLPPLAVRQVRYQAKPVGTIDVEELRSGLDFCL